MIDPVILRFSTQGVAEVKGAFETVAVATRKFEEQATRESQRGTRARIGAAKDEASEKARAHAKVIKDAERLERQRTRAEEHETKARERMHQRSSEMAGRYAAQAARKELGEAKQVAREVERLEEYKMRVRIRSSEMYGRAVAREAAQEARARQTAAQRMADTVGRRVSSGMGYLKNAAGMALGGGALMGGFELANVARREMTFEKTAAQLVNAGTTNGIAPGTVGDVAAQLGAQSKATGVDRTMLAGAALKYSQNARGGDFAGALANTGFFAKLATVSGADINDIAESAGVLQSQNAALGGKEGQADLQQMLLNVLGQTHEGSMSFTDVAKQMGTLGSTRAYFTEDEGKAQRSLIGLGQIARVGGDVGEAGTFVKDISAEVGIANERWRKKTGHNLVETDEHGRMESVEGMIGSVFRETKGDIAQIEGLFGKRGSTLFRELEKSYIGGEKTGGVEGGVKAALANVQQVAGAGMTMDDFNKQYDQSMSTPGAKFEVAVNKIEELLMDKLEPRMAAFADKLPDLIPKIEAAIDAVGNFAEWFASNPLEGVGALVLAAIAKDIAGAAIGAGIKAALLRILGGVSLPGPGGVPIPVPAGGVGGALGRAIGGSARLPAHLTGKLVGAGLVAGAIGATVAGLAGGAAAYVLTNSAIDKQNKDRDKVVLGGAQASADANKTLREVKAGKKVTPADLARLQKEAKVLSTTVDERRQAIGSNPMGTVQTAMMGLFGSNKEQQEFAKNTLADQKAQYASAKASLEDMQKAIKAVTEALGPHANVINKVPPVKSTAPSGPIPGRPTM